MVRLDEVQCKRGIEDISVCKWPRRLQTVHQERRTYLQVARQVLMIATLRLACRPFPKQIVRCPRTGETVNVMRLRGPEEERRTSPVLFDAETFLGKSGRDVATTVGVGFVTQVFDHPDYFSSRRCLSFIEQLLHFVRYPCFIFYIAATFPCRAVPNSLACVFSQLALSLVCVFLLTAYSYHKHRFT